MLSIAEFDYAAAPDLFVGRVGVGPLLVALDTNILIYLAKYGEDIFEGVEPAGLEPQLSEQLAALGAILNIWMMSDIRLYVSPHAVEAGEPERDRELEAQVDNLAEALWHIETWIEQAPSPAPVARSDQRRMQEPRSLGDVVPERKRGRPNPDYLLVADAIDRGCHVFLTNDVRDLVRRSPALAHWGILAMQPTQLLDELVAIPLSLGGLDRLLPDTHKWSYLLDCLGRSGPVQ
ncbi:MAG: hypothetical protein JNK12_08760 [Acidimicrobiales bacterium]|nr:hypothetical protein [Acidimicrobiales bacterium]